MQHVGLGLGMRRSCERAGKNSGQGRFPLQHRFLRGCAARLRSPLARSSRPFETLLFLFRTK
jgi:hypothetical protein